MKRSVKKIAISIACINDEEVVKDATPTNQGKVYGVYMELYRKTVGTIYVDNIKLTTEDHIPVTPTVLETIDFAEAPYTVETGKKINVSTTFAPASVADNYTVSYKMEDENVATVDTAGVVTGVTQGSTTITATATHNTNNNIKISATATVTVTAQEVDENELNFSVNGTGYATLQAAIAAANGSTAEIDLLANVTSSEDITIDSGVTLDLNGYTLDMGNNYLYSLGDVVDNSTGKTGRLVVGTYAEGEKDDVPEGTPKGTLAEANSQMPVYIADEGYMFATMLGQGNVTEATADDFTVDFRPSFGSAYSILAAGADAAKLEFIVRLDWTDEGKNYYQLFKCSDDLVKTIYGQNKIFRVTFNGLTGYKEGMKVTVHVKSDLGVDWLNNSYQMTKTSNE